jgi:hypothetical protein
VGGRGRIIGQLFQKSLRPCRKVAAQANRVNVSRDGALASHEIGRIQRAILSFSCDILLGERLLLSILLRGEGGYQDTVAVPALVAVAVIGEARTGRGAEDRCCAVGIEDVSVLRPLSIKTPVIQQHLIRTRKSVLNGIHQTIREINHNFDNACPGRNPYAVVLQIGQRDGRPHGRALDRLTPRSRTECAASEHHISDSRDDWRQEVGTDGNVNFRIVGEGNQREFVQAIREIVYELWNCGLQGRCSTV